MNRYLKWPDVITPALVAACLVCVLAIGLETDWGRDLKRDVPMPLGKATNQTQASMLPAFTLGSLDTAFPESLNRPLFMPTRRPVPSAAPQAAMKRGQFILVGTNRTKEFGDSAMLKEVSSNKTAIVKAGTTIQDMTVKTVEADRVVLQLGEETEELVMKARANPRPALPAQGGPAGLAPMPAALPPGARPPAGAPPAANVPSPQTAAPGAGIFGGGVPVATPGTPANVNQPQSGVVPPSFGQPRQAASGAAQEAVPGRPTPEEILERRRRARAQQTP